MGGFNLLVCALYTMKRKPVNSHARSFSVYVYLFPCMRFKMLERRKEPEHAVSDQGPYQTTDTPRWCVPVNHTSAYPKRPQETKTWRSTPY
jgi:hypothetical protein